MKTGIVGIEVLDRRTGEQIDRIDSESLSLTIDKFGKLLIHTLRCSYEFDFNAHRFNIYKLLETESGLEYTGIEERKPQ